MSSAFSPHERQFHRLMEFEHRSEAESLFAELLRQGASIVSPLQDFIIRHNNDPRTAILIELLGRLMDDRAVPVLLSFLESSDARLRRAAVNAFGWLRSPAAIEALDQIEGKDHDASVRAEASQAIEEILKDYPRLRDVLRHHRREATREPLVPEDRLPEALPDEQQRLALIGSLPRLLALKFQALPLHLSPGNRIHIAVRMGSERRLIPLMAELTGLEVHLHGWSDNRIKTGIETFYTLGDDDFCLSNQPLSEASLSELIETILARINPQEPACPLDEASDGVEAVQSMLSTLLMKGCAEAEVVFAPPTVSISLGGEALPPPREEYSERFLRALRTVARIEDDHGLHHDRRGRLRLEGGGTVCRLEVISSKDIGREVIRLHRVEG